MEINKNIKNKNIKFDIFDSTVIGYNKIFYYFTEIEEKKKKIWMKEKTA